MLKILKKQPAQKWHRAIGKRLCQERQRLGLSQLDYAKQTGTTPLLVYQCEKGMTQPTLNMLTASIGMGMDIYFVLTGQPVSTTLPSALQSVVNLACCSSLSELRFIMQIIGHHLHTVELNHSHCWQERFLSEIRRLEYTPDELSKRLNEPIKSIEKWFSQTAVPTLNSILACEKQGIDLGYILTGHTEFSWLPPNARTLLMVWNTTSPVMQGVIEAMVKQKQREIA